MRGDKSMIDNPRAVSVLSRTSRKQDRKQRCIEEASFYDWHCLALASNEPRPWFVGACFFDWPRLDQYTMAHKHPTKVTNRPWLCWFFAPFPRESRLRTARAHQSNICAYFTCLKTMRFSSAGQCIDGESVRQYWSAKYALIPIYLFTRSNLPDCTSLLTIRYETNTLFGGIVSSGL